MSIFDGTVHNGERDDGLLRECAKFGDNAPCVDDRKIPAYFYLTVAWELVEKVDSEGEGVREIGGEGGQDECRKDVKHNWYNYTDDLCLIFNIYGIRMGDSKF